MVPHDALDYGGVTALSVLVVREAFRFAGRFKNGNGNGNGHAPKRCLAEETIAPYMEAMNRVNDTLQRMEATNAKIHEGIIRLVALQEKR